MGAVRRDPGRQRIGPARRLAALALLAWLLVPASAPAQAPEWHGTAAGDGEPTVNLYFFWTRTCPHCRQALPFLERATREHPWIRLHSHQLAGEPGNVALYRSMARYVGAEARSVPAFVFCGEMHVGFDTAEGMGAFLLERLEACRGDAVPAAGAAPAPLHLPLLGELDTTALSLPVLTVLLAGLDAFNPCAFFVLLFLLSLLVHARSRARMALVGGIFVATSGLVYFLFMAAWLNVFLVLGQLTAVTTAAGVLAVIAGTLNAKDYFQPRAGPSLSIPESAKPGLFARMRGLLNADSLAAMSLGAGALALAANAYELLCTAGFPMVYTRILTLRELPAAGYYGYLALYNLIYVVPLAAIVAAFTWTLGARKLSEREGRLLKLLSGLMMLGLGVLLVAAPALLNNLLVAAALLGVAGAGTGAAALIERRRAARRPKPDDPAAHGHPRAIQRSR